MMDNVSDLYYLAQLMVRQVFLYLRDLILCKLFWLAAASDDFDSKLVSPKCERDEARPRAPTGTETVSVNFQESLCRAPHATSNAADCIEACGDTSFPRGRILEKNLSHESFSRVRSNHRNRNKSILKRSIFGLVSTQSHNSQSTQTEKLLPKMSQKWLIRRTRSGLVYGRYPV